MVTTKHQAFVGLATQQECLERLGLSENAPIIQSTMALFTLSSCTAKWTDLRYWCVEDCIHVQRAGSSFTECSNLAFKNSTGSFRMRAQTPGLFLPSHKVRSKPCLISSALLSLRTPQHLSEHTSPDGYLLPQLCMEEYHIF